MMINREKIKDCCGQVKALCDYLELVYKKITVTSGYRTPEENIRAGGAKNSQHVLGKAVDIVVENVHCVKVAAVVLGNTDKFPIRGLGIDVYQNYCHFDFRDSASLATWVYGHDGKEA
jgi:uncharacterized protein YcbK (DUF882 family)